jgi:pyruvate dehydrogenase phosphatase
MIKKIFNNFNIRNPILNNKIINLRKLKILTFTIGSSLYIYNHFINKNNINCFFGLGSSSKINNKISLLQFNANEPIEDRIDFKTLENIDADVISVMDGHGGWQLSEFLKVNLIKTIDIFFKETPYSTYLKEQKIEDTKNNYDNYISYIIKKGFSKVENDFKEVALQSYNIGMAKLSSVGSCCLLVLIHNDKAYSANLGDSEGYIFSKSGAIKLNRTLNADNPEEQKRLKETFKNDEDIFICKNKNKNKSCYVKGRLQPTSAFGDFHLKHEEFNNPKEIKCNKS